MSRIPGNKIIKPIIVIIIAFGILIGISIVAYSSSHEFSMLHAVGEMHMREVGFHGVHMDMMHMHVMGMC